MLSSRKILLIASLIIIVAGIGVWTIQYFAVGRDKVIPGNLVAVDEGSSELITNSLEEVEYRIEEFARDLFIPWSMVWSSPERMLISERNGKVREIIDGRLNPKSLRTFSEVSASGEEGLMGMTLDPNYSINKFVYVCYAYPNGEGLVDKVVRLVDRGDLLDSDTVIIDNIPAAKFHAGCRIKFGPDEKLYITTGEATDRQIAQDLKSLGGKILRINSDGSIPADNPFPNSPVWSYGHRNPQGIDWHPTTGSLWQTEHGPSVFDGPAGGDEVNLIEKGANYGWPIVSHEKEKKGLVSPKLVFTPAFAPGSGMFYSSDLFPQFTNNFFFTGLAGEGIIRVIVSKDGKDVVAFEKLKNINFGRIRDIAQGPDGAIYFSTSNKDGRGDARLGDDKIYRITVIK